MDNSEIKPISVHYKHTPIPIDMLQMHTHNRHEVYLLLSGTRRYLIRDGIYDVHAGELVIVPKNELHRTVAQQGSGFERYLVYFSDAETAPVRKAVGDAAFEALLQSRCITLSPEHVEQIRQLLKEMEQENSAEDNCSAAMLSAKLTGLLILLLRWGSTRNSTPDKSTGRIQKVTQYITEHYAEPLTLHDAARIACLEPSYFCRQFKLYTGVGFSEYLIYVRIKAAEKLLLDTPLPVTQIAERCGFSGSNYFRDVFRRINGISPLQYRKQL